MPEFDAPIQKQPGSAGGGVGDLAVGAGFMSNLGKMQSGADNMLKVAKSGGFRSDPEGVRELVKVCEGMIGQIDDKSYVFERLSQAPKLGSGPYALQVANHVRQSADGPQGVVPQLQHFKQTLMKLTEALYRASNQYAEAEELAKMRQQ
ncbi:hypothetical protein [Prauserella alba]|uniref:Excreted virulence factor EspC, type VII ESX diderm n=1 Tax=Prauserella alba TaxID=176898 RepID=A0ABP4G419_9PSEU|nr:hypothetical protein [Prauserella alba]MCP2183566.1 hypothetical protein [Prauserella alba]